MLDFEPYLQASTQGKRYRHEISQLAETQREKLGALVQNLAAAGAQEPLSWAMSELTEDIAQCARFLILKNLRQVAMDIEGNIQAASDCGADLPAQITSAQAQLGAPALQQLLQDYSQGLLRQIIDALDHGALDHSGTQPGWQIMETNPDGELTGRNIGGLHECAGDFHAAAKPRQP